MEADAEKYPSTYQKLINDINNAEIVTDIKVGTAWALVEYFMETDIEPEMNTFIIRLYAVFGR